MSRLRVAGGLVVTPEGAREADVVIRDGRIAAVTPGGSEPGGGAGERPGGAREELLDARGCVVLPGGVDPHTHPLPDLRRASESALAGGTTTLLAFTAPRPGETPADAWRRAERELLPLARTDVRLHPSIWEPERLRRADLVELRSLGATSVKLFLAYPELGMMASDRTLYETLRAARDLGLLTMVHCENGGAIEALVEEQLAAGRTGVEGFVAARPPEVEEEAVARVLALARLAGAPVYLVHLSSAGSLELVREARRRGQAVWAEACTHHLLLDDSCYRRADALAFLTVPPLRSREHVEALWAGVADGTIDAVGSDHAQSPYRPDVPEGDFRAFPYGFAGVEVRVPALLSEGRRRGLAWERLASLLASAPARAFGVAGKGAIAPGADADLVVWAPREEWTVRARELRDGRGSSPYEGLRLDGRVRRVVSRGRVE